MCSSPHRANRRCVVPRIQSSRCFSSSRICSSGMPRAAPRRDTCPCRRTRRMRRRHRGRDRRSTSGHPGRRPEPAAAASGTRGERSAACSRSRRAAAPSRRRIRPSAEPPSCRERRLPLQSVRPSSRRQACTASSSHSRTRSAIMRSAASAHETAASGGSVRTRSKTVRDRDVVRMPSRRTTSDAGSGATWRITSGPLEIRPAASVVMCTRCGRYRYSGRPHTTAADTCDSAAPPAESRTTAMTCARWRASGHRSAASVAAM